MTTPLRFANLRRISADITMLAILISVCAFLHAPVLAQDDPFARGSQNDPFAQGAQNDPFAQGPSSQSRPTVTETPSATPSSGQTAPAEVTPLPEFDESLAESSQLIIRVVQNSDPQTPVELARALQTMLDIEQYDHALHYLSRLQAANLKPEQYYEVHQFLGTDFFLTLHGDETLQPQGREFAREVLAQTKSYAQSPEQIDALVKRLNDNDRSVRMAAFRKLRRLGPLATAAMLGVFADPDRQPEFSYVRAALQVMGPDAKPVLRAGARAANLQVQTESVRALSQFDDHEVTNTLLAIYVSPKSPPSLRATALSALGVGPEAVGEPDQIEQRLHRSAKEFLLGQRRVGSQLKTDTTVWNWDEAAKSMVSSEVASATATRQMAARRAQDLYEMRPDKIGNRQLFVLAQLEAAQRFVGAGQKIDKANLDQRLSELSAAEIESVLRAALKLELIPAATACCDLLGELGTPDLLTGSNLGPSPLIQAILVGDRHLQFAAFEAITRIDPHSAYAGSSYVLTLAVYLANSEGRVAGLVGYKHPDLAQTYAATLQSAGITGVAVNSARELFEQATLNPDLEVILIPDTLSRPDYVELIQQLRNDFRTKRVPIGLLIRDPQHGLRVSRLLGNDPFFTQLSMTAEPSYVASQAYRLRKLVKPWSISEIDRKRHANVALDWLSQVAQEREAYRFYNLGAHQDQLAQLLYIPGFADSASQILVNLGTPAAQRELVNFANQGTLPVEAREKVASAFSEAVQNGGTLLTRQEIIQQYDRYNASAGESEATQKILGSILDAIESRSRKNSQNAAVPSM